MKEYPILFSAPMVNAILEGRKTMTRRVVKPQPDLSILKESARGLEFEFRRMPVLGPTHTPAEWGFVPKYDKANCVPIYGYKCPFGVVGDRLWVRETWKLWEDPEDGHDWVLYRAGGKISFPTVRSPLPNDPFVDKWRPSIFLPRWASRITLEITGVRVERLNDINEKDAIDEGLSFDSCGWFVLGNAKTGADTAVTCFSQLWDSINGKKYPWASNPWVWVIEFRRI